MEPVAKNILKGVLVLELLGLAGTYLLYYRLDSSQDFRYKMNQRCPSILEVYYKSNEWAGVHGKRDRDQEQWLSHKN
uniref:CEBPZ opposite strand n=1 Tax=Sphenodon punctatus TaxID=8508 RepID=A0A8D0HQL6_SPHPU